MTTSDAAALLTIHVTTLMSILRVKQVSVWRRLYTGVRVVYYMYQQTSSPLHLYVIKPSKCDATLVYVAVKLYIIDKRFLVSL